jgi:YidC/Oxa1 family membrane protein insertase
MNLINTVIGTPLGYVMWVCYRFTQNYGLAIILFTLATKLILFPVSLLAQKNSIRMVKLKPRLDEAKARYQGDKDKIADEQIRIYDEEKYSPALGCLPLFLQIPLILGLINVIYNPLQHLLHLGRGVIEQLTGITLSVLQAEHLGAAPQIRVIETIRAPEFLTAFSAVDAGALARIQNLDLSFAGLDLAIAPSLFQPCRLLIIPLCSALSALLLCVVQNRENVLQQQQGFAGKWGMTVFLVAFSLYFTFIVPAGVGLYWIFSNLFSVGQVYILNGIYDPKKYIDYADRPQPLSREEQAAARARRRTERRREKADAKRFYQAQSRRLVFYSEKSGFYKYFENVIEYLLAHSDIVIHYVTGDPDDAVFSRRDPKIEAYYIGPLKLISFMMKMEADMVVMTMPDLQQFHIKRSKVQKDIEYVYMFHAPLSFLTTLRYGALDHYDTIFCTGIYQEKEIRASEKLYNLPAKNLVPCGYGVIENMRRHYLENESRYASQARKRVLIAPSWHYDNILDSCLPILLDAILHKGWQVIVRPHPEYAKRFPDRWRAIERRYAGEAEEELRLETDFSSNETVYGADIVISDWSWISYEFAIAVRKPVLFINTEMKVANSRWQEIPLEPLILKLRGEIGLQLEKEEIAAGAEEGIRALLAEAPVWLERIEAIQNEYLFNFGHSGEAGGEYIISALRRKGERTEA